MTDSTNVFALKAWHFAPPRRAQTVPQCPLPLNHVKYITSNVRDFFFMLLFKRASLFAVKQRRKQREKQKLWCGKSNLLWKRPFSFHHFCSKKKKKSSQLYLFLFSTLNVILLSTRPCVPDRNAQFPWGKKLKVLLQLQCLTTSLPMEERLEGKRINNRSWVTRLKKKKKKLSMHEK